MTTVVKKVNRKRVKSPYRDAAHLPAFHDVAILEQLEAEDRTSVTLLPTSTPSPTNLHPSTVSLPSPATATPTHPSKSSAPAYRHETLTDAEERRRARHWLQYQVQLPGLRQHTTPPAWRDLSDQWRLEWFHHGLRSGGASMAFSLNLSPDVEQQTRQQGSSAGWLSKRIARRLKDALGRRVDFWFAFEVERGRLHIHGEIQIAEIDSKAARKALRLAGGEWTIARQYQSHTAGDPSVVWTGYTAKHAIFIQQLSGPFKDLDRPVNGDWFFATNALRSTASKLYMGRRGDAIAYQGTIK